MIIKIGDQLKRQFIGAIAVNCPICNNVKTHSKMAVFSFRGKDPLGMEIKCDDCGFHRIDDNEMFDTENSRALYVGYAVCRMVMSESLQGKLPFQSLLIIPLAIGWPIGLLYIITELFGDQWYSIGMILLIPWFFGLYYAFKYLCYLKDKQLEYDIAMPLIKRLSVTLRGVDVELVVNGIKEICTLSGIKYLPHIGLWLTNR